MNRRFEPTPETRTVRWMAICGLIGAVAATGCVPMEHRVPERGDIFAPLHRANLAEFDYRLAADDHAGRDDAWTDVGYGLLEFAGCRALPGSPPESVRSTPRARLVWELIELEDRRRLRLHTRDRTDWRSGTIHEQFSTAGFFDRTADDPADELVRWPDRGEAWPDEWPARRDVDHRCDAFADRQGPDELSEPFADLDSGSVAGRMAAEWLQSRRVDEAIESLDERELRERARRTVVAHRADLALSFPGATDATTAAGETKTELAEKSLDELLEVADDEEPTFDLALRIARLATELDRVDAAIAAHRRLTDHPVDSVAETSRYHATRLAWREGRWEEAARTATPLVEASPALRSAHAYFGATAHLHAGRDDAFFGIARDVLRDRDRRADDPFVGALYRQALRQLARYDVDERTEELLEEFGPRAALPARKRELAEVALDLGRPQVAEQMVRPLLDRTRDARKLPRLHAILALAAFLRDDRETFDRHVDELVERPDQLEDVIPPGRRAMFFAHRDTQLARVLRATLPLMAEWGDGPGARAMRQRWLEALVEHARRFLRETPESAVSEDLAELYRLAGELLEDHPRGYARRVGRQEPSASALVLGTVDMPPSPPLDEAPRPRLRWPAIPSLLLIPHGGVPPRGFVSELEPDAPEQSDR